MEHIPDCGELCSPFLGGGSVELAVAARGTKVYGYDIFEPLVWFWKALSEDRQVLADMADSYRKEHEDYKKGDVKLRGLLKDDFMSLREELREETEYSLENAAKFYAINRSSFSGATFSGGWSKKASYARFTDSSIDRIREFEEPNLKVGHADFKESILTHPDAFLYLDPPYMLSKKQQEKLYGDKGNTHEGFDHQGLYELLKDRKNWVMSYGGDADAIFDMYKDFEIIDLSGKWSYGMKNVKSTEIKEEIKKLQEEKDKLAENSKGLLEANEQLLKLDASIKEKKKMGKSSEILILGDRK